MRFFVRFLCVFAVVASVALAAEGKKKEKKEDVKPAKSAYASLTGRDSLRMDGLMNVVSRKDTMFFEMPVELFGREMLVVNRLQRVPKELNESGVNKGVNYENQVVRFEWDKKNKTVTIRQQRVTPEVSEKDAMAPSVRDNYLDPVISVIKVRAVGPDSASVIFPVNKLFNGSEACLNDVFHGLNISQTPNAGLSRILSIKSHPNNVSALSELTTMVREGHNRVYVSVVVSTSLLLLPEEPMMGREESSRVGYFSDPVLSYSDDQQKTKVRHYISRWRLEPEDRARYESGKLTRPKKQIVFYLDKSIPESMRPYIRQGILDWNEAFECAGFCDVMRAEDMTDSIESEEDDLRYSEIVYAASQKANAMGPCITDPRSGEILEADVIWWHNVKKLLSQWIKVQTSPYYAPARQLTLPDSLIGDAARFVASHEVGHSLGLRHNMRASSAFPTDSLRSQSFIDRMGGVSASIMDYARYNYVAQPGDGVKVRAPRIGIYDKMAIEWGYRWYSTEAEAKIRLSEFLRDHSGKEYMYSETGGLRNAVNPSAMSEDLGDDPVKSASYGVANLKRIVPNIISWTSTGDIDQTWEEAAELWGYVISQWDMYNYHVMANIGGMYLENTFVDDGKKTYTYVPAERQRASVKYIIDNVLNTPKWLMPESLTSHTYLLKNGLESHPMASIRTEQNYMFWDMLTNERLMRMLQAEADLGAQAFTAAEMIDMLHTAVFTSKPNPDVLQRSVQKSMVDALITAASEGEGVKVNSRLVSPTPEGVGGITESRNHGFTEGCAILTGMSGISSQLSTKSATSGPRTISWGGSQLIRTSDAISLKRGELMRIRAWAKARIGEGRTAVQMHCLDLVQRIESALGI